MINCPPPDVLSALIDGECGANERRDAHEHLQACEGCRRTMNEIAAVQRLVHALPRLTAPEALVSSALRVRKPFPANVLHVFRGPRRWVVAAAAGAACVVSVAGLAMPPAEEEAPVDVFVARHASLSSNNVTGHVVFTVSGR